MRRKLEKAARLLSALLVFFLLYLIFVYTKLDLSAPIATPQTMLEIGQSVASDKKNSALFAQCPARIYSGIWHRPHIDNILFSRRIRAAYCKKTPDKCLQKCTNGKNGEYCFELARAFETYEWPQEIGTLEMQDFSGRLFALACAYGSAAGCTNRAAGIRNDRHSEDPFNDLASQQPKIKACLFSTFQLACGAKDAWGCTMLGQSYAMGEGTKVNVTKAKAEFTAACLISSKSEACETAKRWARDLIDDNEKND